MSDDSAFWTKQQTLCLIRELKKYPCLYNTTDQDFLNRTKKTMKLTEILKVLKRLKSDVTLKAIKTKIRTLQSQVSRERTKLKKFKQRGEEKLFEKSLWCYDEVSFMFNTTNAVLDTSNVEFDMDETENTEEALLITNPKFCIDETENIEETVVINSPKYCVDETENTEENLVVKTPKNKNKPIRGLQEHALEVFSSVNSYFEEQKTKEPTREEEFCKFLCSHMKQIKLEDTFNDAAIEILTIVNNSVKKEKKLFERKKKFQDSIY